MTESVAVLEQRVNATRRAGDLVALLQAAEAGADEIEGRVGTYQSAEAREALTAVKRFTFNAAADCWPGWSIPEERPDTQVMERALELARRSVALVKRLGLGPVQEGTGIWLVGAFELALGRYLDARNTFIVARRHYIEAQAPGLVLLTEGYVAIAAHEDLDGICARIAAGDFEDGAEWIEQLHTAHASIKAQHAGGTGSTTGTVADV